MVNNREIALIRGDKVYYVFTPLKLESEKQKTKRAKMYDESQRPPGYDDNNGKR
jgi:hypothetical protein